MTTVETLWALLEPWLEAERLELDDVEMSGSGRARTIRVVVDRPGGGVDVDTLAQVSEAISRLLDAETDLAGPYRLEVTSPGLERPLKRPRHWQKSVGREVTVKVQTPAGTQTLRGVLEAADEEVFSVRSDRGPVTHPYRAVVSARTVFRWEKSPRPGKKK
ncbi:MAG: ribosome maturation factor RimP [Acidimicrobiia bacterium]|jgi:ribosome maturation factor RimP|nr:MAG: ribosome maturation factor RimP [Acidimicrobiia bacterium]